MEFRVDTTVSLLASRCRTKSPGKRCNPALARSSEENSRDEGKRDETRPACYHTNVRRSVVLCSELEGVESPLLFFLGPLSTSDQEKERERERERELLRSHGVK